MHGSTYGDSSPERVNFPPTKETWHEPIDSGKFTGFVIDMLPYTAKRMVNRKLEHYSALRLFVNTVGSMRRKYTFLVRYNPYFYFIAKNDQDEEALRYVLELKQNKMPDTEGISKIDKVQAHVLTNSGHHQRFLSNSTVYKLILHDPKDVPKYASALKRCKAIKDVREFDIPYQHRVGMDLGIYVGKKYKFIVRNGIAESHELIDDNELPLLDTFVFDIEVRKKPVHPPKDDDPIDIFGLQINEKGYLFNNVELTYFELPDFWLGVKETEAEVTIENEKDEPQTIKERRDMLVQLTEEEALGQTWKNKPIFFKTINCINEKHLLNEFKNFIIKAKPDYVSGFNSDRFDFPHIIARSKVHGIKYDGLLDYDKWEEAYMRSGAIFADAWHWVDRDAYLSKGMRGLKAATLQKMDIHAMETDHEQQVREWVYMRDVLLNAENEMHASWENTVKEMLVPDNEAKRYEKIKDITDRNRKLAFDRAFRFARYCASDVYVTDLMIRRFVVNFNLAVSTLIPMTVFETSRKPRGPMVELILLKGMQGSMIAPNKIIKEKHYTISPLDIKQQYNEIYVSLNKKIDDEDFDYWVPLLTRNEMIEHCKGCANTKCQIQWKDIWGKNLASQKPIRCSRDSPEDDPENDVYYAPLNGGKMIVDNPKYEGAFVHCYQSGIFKDNEAYKFKIDIEYLKTIESKFISTITETFKKFESNPYKIQEGVYATAKIRDPEKIIEKVRAQFATIYNNIVVEDGKTYWIGLPNLVHVDVSSMYPNIIITYNLQPYGVVTEKDCAECPYNWKKCGDPCECWHDIKWSAVDEVWNIESIDITKALNEIEALKSSKEKKDRKEIDATIKKIFKSYVKGQKQISEYKYPITSRFCQKAHKLFTNTLIDFRNGRYTYKYKGTAAEDEMRRYRSLLKENTDPNNTPIYEKKVNDLSMQKIYYESMQLGLKVLLNTFYGYLAGPSARFRSIPAAGGTCGRGRDIIMHAINFCDPFAINIEVDTDGVWTALPSVLPTQIKYDFDYFDPIKKTNESGKGKIKIFNEVLNKEILAAFGNAHNYEPCSADGIIRNNAGEEWMASSDQSVYENQIYKYERDPEWWVDPHWKNVPKCSISFDFEGPYSFIYLYRKKRMKASQRDEKNPLIQEDTTVTGLDELRKGELIAVQELSKNVTEIGKQGKSLKIRYEKAVEWINENLLDPIHNKTLNYEYIMESKDISQDTYDKVISAYKLYQNFLKKYEIDPASMPLHDYALEKACDTDVKKEIAIGKKGFFTKMKGQAYTMTAVRTIDLGNPINPEDSVQWFICKYPQWFIQSRGKMVKHQAKTSQRAIPINVFNASPDEIRKYMKQWIGQIPIKLRDADGKIEYAYKDPDSIKIEDYIDWDYYLDRIESRIKYYAIKPAKNQGYDLIRMGLHVRAFNEEKKEKGKESLLNAFMGMAVRKSK